MEPRAVSVLAFIIVLGFFAIVGTLIFHEVPDGSKDILGPLIGVIGAAVGTIVGYVWGSSSGSKAHSQTVKELTGTGDGAGTVNTKEKIVSEKIVTTEKTTPAVADWVSGADYKVGQSVTVGTQKYQSLSEHTSAAENQPGTGEKWAEFWKVE